MTCENRFSHDAGIAIGPILFVIAIVAVLAAAVLAERGKFAPDAGTESDRAKSSVLIHIGENLKIGANRVLLQGGADIDAVDTNPDDTTGNNALFSPSGGGVTVPPVSAARDPDGDQWNYVKGPIAGFGSSASDGSGDELFAVLPVTRGVCAEINNRTTGNAVAPEGVDLGDFTSLKSLGALPGPAWPQTNPELRGVGTGCVNNINAHSSGYYFYQILAIR